MPSFTEEKWEVNNFIPSTIYHTPEGGAILLSCLEGTEKQEEETYVRVLAAAPDMYSLLKAMTTRTCNNCRDFKKQARELLKSIDSEDNNA